MAFRLCFCVGVNGGSGFCALPILEESEMDIGDMNSSRSKRKKRKKSDTDKLAAQLAPLEEQNRSAAEQQIGGRLGQVSSPLDPESGAIIVDNEDLKVPTDIMETNEKRRFFGIEPVVIVVLVLILSFILFITWQISKMPAK